jgi:hypothetical protein
MVCTIVSTSKFVHQGAPSSLVENEEEISQSSRDSGSDLLPNGSTPLEDDSQEPQLRRSEHEKIPRRYFEIEREVFMVALYDGDEPRSYHEAVSSLSSNEWMKAMNEEIKSMRTYYLMPQELIN